MTSDDGGDRMDIDIPSQPTIPSSDSVHNGNLVPSPSTASTSTTPNNTPIPSNTSQPRGHILHLPWETLSHIAGYLRTEDVMALTLTASHFMGVYTNPRERNVMFFIKKTLFGHRSTEWGLSGPKYKRKHRPPRWRLLIRLERDLDDYDLCWYCKCLHRRGNNMTVCCVRDSLTLVTLQLNSPSGPNQMDRWFLSHMKFTKPYVVMKAHRRGTTASFPVEALQEDIPDGGIVQFPCVLRECNVTPEHERHHPDQFGPRQHVPFRVWPRASYEAHKGCLAKYTNALVCIDEFATIHKKDKLKAIRGVMFKSFQRICAHGDHKKSMFWERGLAHVLDATDTTKKNRVMERYRTAEETKSVRVWNSRCRSCPTTVTVEVLQGMNVSGIYFVVHIWQNLGSCETPLSPGWFNCFGGSRDIPRLAPPGELAKWKRNGTPCNYIDFRTSAEYILHEGYEMPRGKRRVKWDLIAQQAKTENKKQLEEGAPMRKGNNKKTEASVATCTRNHIRPNTGSSAQEQSEVGSAAAETPAVPTAAVSLTILTVPAGPTIPSGPTVATTTSTMASTSASTATAHSTKRRKTWKWGRS